MNLHERLTQPFIPDEQQSDREKKQQRLFALIVGLIAFALPLTLYFGPLVWGGCERYSISHFYYSPFWGGAFIGMLAFIGTYLVAYRGDTTWESFAAFLAGISAFGVALIPAGGHGCLKEDGGEFRARAFAQFSVDGAGQERLLSTPDSTDFFLLQDRELIFGLNVADLHYVCAFILFLTLLYFCLVIFMRADARHKDKDGSLTRVKKTRNAIYLACGMLIILSMVMLGIGFLSNPVEDGIDTAWNRSRSTFWWEAIALWAFGFSWMVKGRFIRLLIDDSEKEQALQAH